MKLSNRILAVWAIAVFLVVGLVFVLIAVLVDGDTDSQQEPPVQRSVGVAR